MHTPTSLQSLGHVWRPLSGLWLALVLLLAALPWAHAAESDLLPVPALSGRVIDQTGTLNPAQLQEIDTKLAELERAQGSQVVVLMVPTTQPEDIAAYAYRVADSWKIGRREVGDGVLLIVAKNDRRVRIEVARALEGAIPDLAARQIIDTAITPAFRAGNYAAGLSQAVDRIGQRIKGEGLPLPDEKAHPRAQGTQWEDLGIFLFVGVPILGAVLTAVMGRKLGSAATGVAAGALGWWWTTSLLISGVAGLAALVLVGALGAGSRGGRSGGWGGGFGGGMGGGGGWGGGGGGGFSSGGGGSFGGGGASGNW